HRLSGGEQGDRNSKDIKEFHESLRNGKRDDSTDPTDCAIRLSSHAGRLSSIASRLSLYVEIGDEGHNSKIHANRKNPSRFSLVQIEDIGREIHFLIGETHEKSALDIDIGVIGPRSLAYQTNSKPIHRRDAQLGPVV